MDPNLRMMCLHITPVCEYRCPFCYMASSPHYQHPPAASVLRVIQELAAQSVSEVLLCGGDPCLYPDLKAIVEEGHRLGLVLDVISNTLRIDGPYARNRIRAFDATILGSTAVEHDSITGATGSYFKLVRNIKHLTSEGQTVGIVLNATSQSHNKSFETVRALVEGEGILPNHIRYVMVQRIIPRGRATNTTRYAVSREQIPALFSGLEKIEKEFGLKIIFEDPFPLCVVPSRYHRFLSPCEWGYTKGSVNWNGNVSRCGADTRFQVGNIFHEPLKDIWAHSPILRSFRGDEWMPEACRECPLLDLCRCGCSLSRSRPTREDHEPDILCPHGDVAQHDVQLVTEPKEARWRHE